MFSIAPIRGRLPHVKDPQSGYTLLPKNLQTIQAILSQATPHITDTKIQEALTTISNAIAFLLTQLPQPMEESLNQLIQFLEKYRESCRIKSNTQTNARQCNQYR